jgi:predicted nucleic acid-binding protein
MILVDTGPLVALFDPADGSHARCVRVLRTIDDVLRTTVPVLTEAFHLLSPASIGAQRLMDFVEAGGMSVRDLDDRALNRAFELMVQYADHPMDLADASLVVAAELDVAKTVFTIDRRDFGAYRYKRGHRHYRFEMIG